MAEPCNKTLKLIWLTDLHLLPAGHYLAGYDTMTRLDRAVSYIQQHHQDADFCILSGDLTDTGDVSCYQHLHNVMSALGIRYLPLTGNHDVRRTLRKHLQLPESASEHFVQYAVYQNDLRIIALDTLSEGVSDGRLCKERLTWLADELSRDPESPTLIFCHHPPEALNLSILDTSRLVDGKELLDLLRQFSNIKHLCFGHVHRPVSGSFDNLAFTALRSTSIQAPLPYPEWNWESFKPASEAPDLGIIYFSADSVVIQQHPFCKPSDDQQA